MRGTDLSELPESGRHDENIRDGVEGQEIKVGEVEVDVLGVFARDWVHRVKPR